MDTSKSCLAASEVAPAVGLLRHIGCRNQKSRGGVSRKAVALRALVMTRIALEYCDASYTDLLESQSKRRTTNTPPDNRDVHIYVLHMHEDVAAIFCLLYTH